MKTIYNFVRGTDWDVNTSASGSSGYIGIIIKNQNFKNLLENQLDKINIWAHFTITTQTPGGTSTQVTGGFKVTTFVYELPGLINSNAYSLYIALYGASRFNSAVSQITSINVTIGD